MTIALDIPSEIEDQARQAAAEQGKRLETYILELIRHAVTAPSGDASGLPAREAELLQQINQGLTPATWQRYHDLRARRQAHTLTPAEQQELIAITDERERANVQRVAALIRLAQLRQTSVNALMDDLGLHAATYA
ncbi:MAG: hypothetical protein ACLFVO_23870 [Chloroflexaceae bacterium]